LQKFCSSEKGVTSVPNTTPYRCMWGAEISIYTFITLALDRG
jgi:hypothetical protein